VGKDGERHHDALPGRALAAAARRRHGGAGDEPEPEEGDAPPPEKFRESHRLAWTVGTIDHDASVLPRGAWVVDASHAVVKNKAYEGLTYEAAGALANYYHFRPPESSRAVAALAKPGIVRPSDFMDPCAEDTPAGVWALCYDPSNTMALLRNLYWPGYHFYQVIDSPEHGGVYFGDGLPNLDLAFML